MGPTVDLALIRFDGPFVREDRKLLKNVDLPSFTRSLGEHATRRDWGFQKEQR